MIPPRRIYKLQELNTDIINTDIINKVQAVEINIDEYDIETEDIFNTICKYSNIREIILKTTYDFNPLSQNIHIFNNKIALMQNLAEIEIEYPNTRSSLIDELLGIVNHKYIYNDCMLFTKIIIKEDIPENITKLNIININEATIQLLNNLPDNIEYLHLSTCILNNNIFKNLNLPITLKKLSITLISYDEIYSFDVNKIKLPFNCQIIINKIIY